MVVSLPSTAGSAAAPLGECARAPAGEPRSASGADRRGLQLLGERGRSSPPCAGDILRDGLQPGHHAVVGCPGSLDRQRTAVSKIHRAERVVCSVESHVHRAGGSRPAAGPPWPLSSPRPGAGKIRRISWTLLTPVDVRDPCRSDHAVSRSRRGTVPPERGEYRPDAGAVRAHGSRPRRTGFDLRGDPPRRVLGIGGEHGVHPVEEDLDQDPGPGSLAARARGSADRGAGRQRRGTGRAG